MWPLDSAHGLLLSSHVRDNFVVEINYAVRKYVSGTSQSIISNLHEEGRGFLGSQDEVSVLYKV